MIEVNQLCKSFGSTRAISGIGFHVAAGEIFGLLGPNGAGKTTTLRILSTLLGADAGSALVAGHDVSREPEKVRASIGVVNGGMGLYDRLSGREILQYFGRLYGMDSKRIGERIAVLSEALELGETLERHSGSFSTGMRQKVVIARALLHDPPVIFFDEATSGLDIMTRRSLLDLVSRFASEGKAVVYSTHVMSEVEELCDRLAIIFRGEVAAQGTVPEILASTDSSGLEQAFFTAVGRYRSGEAAA